MAESGECWEGNNQKDECLFAFVYEGGCSCLFVCMFVCWLHHRHRQEQWRSWKNKMKDFRQKVKKKKKCEVSFGPWNDVKSKPGRKKKKSHVHNAKKWHKQNWGGDACYSEMCWGRQLLRRWVLSWEVDREGEINSRSARQAQDT